jgi:hypothetical protein
LGERRGDRIMQDDDIACLDVDGEEGVSILPPLAVSVSLNRTERRTARRHPAEHRVQALHHALQRLAQLQESPVRSHPVVVRRLQTVLERVRGGFLCRNGGHAPDGPAGQPLGCAPADQFQSPHRAMSVRRVELLDQQARHGMSPRTWAVVFAWR